MKALALIALLTLSTIVSMAQKITFDNDVSVQQENNNASLSTELSHIPGSGKLIKLSSHDAFIVFDKIRNPKSLDFQYQWEVPSGDVIVVISTRSLGNDFVEKVRFTLNKNPVATNRYYDYFTSINELNDVDVKISLELLNGSNGMFYLDNVNFTLIPPDEVSKIKAALQRDIQTARLVAQQSTSIKVSDFNARVELAKVAYIENLDQLRDLSYRSNVLSTISKLVLFVNNRTKVNDPNNYDAFTAKIDFIKANCDTIKKKYIERLMIDAKPKEFAEPVATQKKSSVLKFVQILGDVGNIITGGQLKSVINSIQGVVSTVFDPAVLMAKNPEYIVNNSNNKNVSNPKFIQDQVPNLLSKGLEIQGFLYQFFDILNKDSEEFGELVSDFQYQAQLSDNLIAEIDKTRTDYFRFFNSSINENDDFYKKTFLAIKTNTERIKLDEIKSEINVYFNGLNQDIKSTKIPSEILRKLEIAESMNREISDLTINYSTQASNLANIFNNVKTDLEKPNPFGINGQANPKFGKSFDDYSRLRATAKKSFDDMKGNLDLVLR